MKKEVKVGTKVIFNGLGGRMSNSSIINIGQIYTIKKLSSPFNSEGDCNATLDNGGYIRLSTLDNYTEPGLYQSYFKIIPSIELYEIY